MMMAQNNGRNELYSHNMSMAMFWSAVFHISVFVMATLGLPHISREIMPMEMAITIEMADLADFSQTNILDKPQESKEKQKPKKAEPIYNKTENAPDLLSPQTPDTSEIEEDIPDPSNITTITPKVLEDKSIIKKPPKPRNKPRHKPKTVEPKSEPKPKDKKDFTSLLKSLTPDEPSQSPPLESENQDLGQASQIADFSKQMTRNEFDDLNRGVQKCWNVNAGGKDAHNLIVELLVFVNQDRTVREVKIVDKLRYNSDSHFKSAAEAARRALLNQRCSTLNLPPEKYERWKKFRYIFDPSQML